MYPYDSVREIVVTDRAYKKWVAACKTDATKKNKTVGLCKFIHFVRNNMNMSDATPAQLILQATDFQDAQADNKKNDKEKYLFGDEDDKGDAHKILLEYRKFLSTLKSGTAKTNFASILHFYRFFEIKIDIDIDKATTAPENDAIPNIPDLRQIMQESSLRDKCIISAGITSGMARQDIVSLTVQQFKKGIKEISDGKNTIKICALSRLRIKGKIKHHTFLGNETVTLIERYLAWRDDTENPLYTKRKVYKETDKIFLRENISDKFLETMDDNIRAMQPQTVSKMFIRLSDRLGFNRQDGYYSHIRSHAMRKYFSNAYKGIDYQYKEHWMGHAGGVAVRYDTYNAEEGIEYYLQGLDSITILSKVETTTLISPSVDKLKWENQLLKDDVKTLMENQGDTAKQVYDLRQMIKGTPAFAQYFTEEVKSANERASKSSEERSQ